MRIGYILELVFAIGLGLGLARYRLTNPDLGYSFGVPSWFVSFEIGSDAFFTLMKAWREAGDMRGLEVR